MIIILFFFFHCSQLQQDTIFFFNPLSLKKKTLSIPSLHENVSDVLDVCMVSSDARVCMRMQNKLSEIL